MSGRVGRRVDLLIGAMELIGGLLSLLAGGTAFWAASAGDAGPASQPQKTVEIPQRVAEAIREALPATTEAPGLDAEQRTALFKVVVLSRHYNWAFDSDREVLLNDRPLEDLVGYLRSLRSLKKHRDLVAVGMASCEGSTLSQRILSHRRAEQLSEWLRGALDDPDQHRLFSLSLGRRVRGCSPGAEQETADQRMVVLVGVLMQDPGVLLGEALRDALRKHEPLGIDPDDYEHFEFRAVWES